MEKIDILSILNNTWEDRGGIAGWQREAHEVRDNPLLIKEYLKSWCEFVPNLIILDTSQRSTFFDFARESEIASRKLYQTIANFVKTEWTEEKYPDWRIITARGNVITNVVDFDKNLFPSYSWIFKNSRILFSFDKWKMFDIFCVYFPEKSLKEVHKMLKEQNEVFGKNLMVRTPLLLKKYDKHVFRNEIEPLMYLFTKRSHNLINYFIDNE